MVYNQVKKRLTRLWGGYRTYNHGCRGYNLGYNPVISAKPLSGGLLEAILRLKMAQDRRRWLKIAPKHETLVKYEVFWGYDTVISANSPPSRGPRGG